MGNSQTANLLSSEEETGGSQFNEVALRSEVSCWREMIQARSEDLPAEAVERMHYALALAEHRLVELYGSAPGRASSRGVDFARANKRVSTGH